MSTFGNTNIQATAQSYTKNLILGQLFTGGPTSGTLQSISMYGAAVSSGNSVAFAIYDGTSKALIGNTSSDNPSTTAGWVTLSASGTLSNASGNYYIVWNGTASASSAWTGYYDTGTQTLYDMSETFGMWPTTLTPNADFTNRIYSMYFTYTTSSGATGITGQFLMTSI